MLCLILQAKCTTLECIKYNVRKSQVVINLPQMSSMKKIAFGEKFCVCWIVLLLDKYLVFLWNILSLAEYFVSCIVAKGVKISTDQFPPPKK